ncbi:pyridoxal 5'-phosphate synthase domain protein [Pseudarthrobacter siccitolerans]|uniref:Pyridoxal 5'-phosphate synthase domain protein n=1 Tax=Pseudarthrobacter siccitolerans TaxID=861266 RepID=A0A024H497_9MICC|nr:pyridoxal 5'-phosphate synthase domain protein [Pseudarthrobacter siccitolerans]
MSETFRKFLRTLPDFPAELPGFDPDKAPQEPHRTVQTMAG